MRDIKIAISGKSGCGNTTISKMVAEKLGLTFINFTFRTLAQEQGISLKEVLDRAAQDDSWDKEVDTRQVQLARESKGCVLGSRLAIWMLDEADVKVFLTASAETRAARIVKREGGSLEAIAAFTAERDRQDRSRYLRIYNIDNDNHQFADIIIDTDNLSPDEIAGLIIKKAQECNGH
ncbi:MAG: cytidylate kinase family protein [Treponema sp.]|jgi:cytidylate kinase|nr:cytidylate kinase family protein [Treponema sp.]